VLLSDPTPNPLFHPNFGGVLVAPDRIAHVGVSPCIYLKLFGREIIFEVFQFPTYVITVPERHRQTERQTDDILWHNCALHGIVW